MTVKPIKVDSSLLTNSPRSSAVQIDPYRDLLNDAAERAQRYLFGIQQRHAGVSQHAIANLSALAGPLPEAGDDPYHVLGLLDEFGSPATAASMGRRFF